MAKRDRLHSSGPAPLIGRRKFLAAASCTLVGISSAPTPLQAATVRLQSGQQNSLPSEFFETLEAGGQVRLEPGTYSINRQIILADLAELHGVSPGNTTLLYTGSDAAISITGNDARIDSLRILLAPPPNTTTVGIIFKGDSNGAQIHNVSLVAQHHDQDSERKGVAHGITCDNISRTNRIQINRCHFQNLGYGIFTQNLFNGIAKNWTISECTFTDNLADDIELNSDNNPNQPWSGTSITGNLFERRNAEFSHTSGFGVGMDSAKFTTISANTFIGYAREAIHIEDFCSNIIVSNNTLRECECGICIYQDHSINVLISNNVITAKPREWGCRDIPHPNSSTIGVHVTNPGVSHSCTAILVTNNIINGYEIGVYAPLDRGGEANGNLIHHCLIGLYIPPHSNGRVAANRIMRCKFAFHCIDSAISRNTLEDVLQLCTPTSRGGLAIEAISVQLTEATAEQKLKSTFFDTGIPTHIKAQLIKTSKKASLYLPSISENLREVNTRCSASATNWLLSIESPTDNVSALLEVPAGSTL